MGIKRCCDTQSEARNAKKRVTHDTFLKWKCDLDRECQTMTWLDCEMESGKKIVEKLNAKCVQSLSIKFVGESTLATNGSVELTPFVQTTSATTSTMISTYTRCLYWRNSAQKPLDWVQRRMLPSWRLSIHSRKTKAESKVWYSLFQSIVTATNNGWTVLCKFMVCFHFHGIYRNGQSKSTIAGNCGHTTTNPYFELCLLH